jgi:hypothetical protein
LRHFRKPHCGSVRIDETLYLIGASYQIPLIRTHGPKGAVRWT